MVLLCPETGAGRMPDATVIDVAIVDDDRAAQPDPLSVTLLTLARRA